MLAELRHARRGGVLALHVLLLCAGGRTPTEIATFLFCSRTSVYRIVNAYHPAAVRPPHRSICLCGPRETHSLPQLRHTSQTPLIRGYGSSKLVPLRYP